MLPSENSLALAYSVSRETVRKGLRELESEGYIYPVAGKGYFVAKPTFSQFNLFFPEEEGSDLVSLDLILLTPEEPIAQALKLEKRSAVIAMERIMVENGSRYAVDLKYLPYKKGHPTIEEEIRYAVFPELIAQNRPSYSFYTEMQITAEPADARIATKLQCEEGVPLLVMRRYFITNDGKPIAYGVRYLRGGSAPLRCFSGAVPDHLMK